MTGGELWMRCFKARLQSWLMNGKVAASITTPVGVIALAIYDNGRYVNPEEFERSMWGPDGPINMGGGMVNMQGPPQPGETEEGEQPEENGEPDGNE